MWLLVILIKILWTFSFACKSKNYFPYISGFHVNVDGDDDSQYWQRKYHLIDGRWWGYVGERVEIGDDDYNWEQYKYPYLLCITLDYPYLVLLINKFSNSMSNILIFVVISVALKLTQKKRFWLGLTGLSLLWFMLLVVNVLAYDRWDTDKKFLIFSSL